MEVAGSKIFLSTAQKCVSGPSAVSPVIFTPFGTFWPLVCPVRIPSIAFTLRAGGWFHPAAGLYGSSVSPPDPQ